jgi:aspartate racemase
MKHMINRDNFNTSKHIGIVAHSYEGGALCFTSACREGAAMLGPHMHPNIVLSAIPMGLSLQGWESDNRTEIHQYFIDGVSQVARAGAHFFICPDNTAHLVLENIISDLAIPGLHIAEVVCHDIVSKGWTKVGLLGTRLTMTGSVYENALKARGLEKIVPNATAQAAINKAIFDELCMGEFKEKTIGMFLDAIRALKKAGAECVILGCTEIPLIINNENAHLPVLDSTRLLATYSVKRALSEQTLPSSGWIDPAV